MIYHVTPCSNQPLPDADRRVSAVPSSVAIQHMINEARAEGYEQGFRQGWFSASCIAIMGVLVVVFLL
jgi:hypothetical protein